MRLLILKIRIDRKSTRLNSSHTVIYTLSLHDALPILVDKWLGIQAAAKLPDTLARVKQLMQHAAFDIKNPNRSEEHTSELQSHSDLHSFPTRRSSDLG